MFVWHGHKRSAACGSSEYAGEPAAHVGRLTYVTNDAGTGAWIFEMDEIRSNTRQCPHCGVVNDMSRALCSNCQSPLTAYGGQLNGVAYQGKLAAQASQAAVRPAVVTAMTLFDILYAVFWPIAYVIGAYMGRAQLNTEGTNYVAAALGSLGPLFSALALLPIGAMLCFLAWSTWTQRTWAWTANAWTIGIFVLIVFMKHQFSLFTFVCAGLAGALAYFWFLPRARAWFGLSAS